MTNHSAETWAVMGVSKGGLLTPTEVLPHNSSTLLRRLGGEDHRQKVVKKKMAVFISLMVFRAAFSVDFDVVDG